MSDWMVYLLRTEGGALYTGITTDIRRRVSQHSSGRGGAKFFRHQKPVALAFLEEGHDRSSASRREAEIKKFSKSVKEQLVADFKIPDELQNLFGSEA